MAWQEQLSSFWARIGPYAEKLAVWRGYEAELQTLLIYGVGIAVYTALVFTFYQSLSKRKPIKMSDAKSWGGRLSRFTGAALIFPVLSFLYFAVLAVALFFLAKTQSTGQILLISMAVVVGVRVTVYLSEAMSNDLAKLVPLSLLAVLLVDPGYLTLEAAWARLGESTQMLPLLGRYFLVFIALEAVLSGVRFGILKMGARWHAYRDATYSLKRANADPVSVPVKELSKAEIEELKKL